MKALSSKKYGLLFILIITTLLLSMTMFNKIAAEDNDVNLIISEKGESSPPIFNSSDSLLAPGINISKRFDIQNKTTRNYYIGGITVKNFRIKDSSNSLITDLSIINYFCDNVKCKIGKVELINNQISNETIYEGKLSDLVAQDGVSINNENLTISSGNSKKIAIEIAMDNNVDNRVQGLSCNLDIQIVAISKDNSGVAETVVIGGDASLIKTGSFFDTTTLIPIGSLIVTLGIIIRMKKSNGK
ncbi:MAG TPA: hypothetical protein VIK72_00430 [Clostridiaceae bacterium]